MVEDVNTEHVGRIEVAIEIDFISVKERAATDPIILEVTWVNHRPSVENPKVAATGIIGRVDTKDEATVHPEKRGIFTTRVSNPLTGANAPPVAIDHTLKSTSKPGGHSLHATEKYYTYKSDVLSGMVRLSVDTADVNTDAKIDT